MEKEKIGEIYEKLKQVSGIFKLYKEAEEENKWEDPAYRRSFGKYIYGNEEAYAGEPSDVVRDNIRIKLSEKSVEASKELYDNFFEIIKYVNKDQIKDLAEIMEAIPPQKEVSKELEEIQKLHTNLYTLASFTFEQFKEFLKRIGHPDAYSVVGSQKLGKLIYKHEVEAARNFLIGELRKLWEKYNK